MNHSNNTPPSDKTDCKTNGKPNIKPDCKPIPKLSRRVNWHEAAACAIEIELRDYADILDFYSEYVLGKNDYRIDLLVIKALSSQPIPKNIAHCFRTYNLFEIKGIHSSVTASAYYKTIGYAGLLLSHFNGSKEASDVDVSISFLSFHYPRKLIQTLKKKNHFVIEKSSPGIYYIGNNTFDIQIIVIPELPLEENLYLRCLADDLRDRSLTNRLAGDYAEHQNEEIYIKYLHQLSLATLKPKGEPLMVCEGLLNLFGTSSEEIIAKTRKEEEAYYLPKLNEQSATIEQLSSQNDYLKNLLRQHNISFE